MITHRSGVRTPKDVIDPGGWNWLLFSAFIIFFLSFLPTAIASSQAPEDNEIFEAQQYPFPVIEPEIAIAGGYRFTDFSGSARAAEYEYLHNSVFLGGELRLFSYPYRLHLDVELKSRKDYFGDFTYAYKDIVYFRGINRTLFHNLENITLLDLDAGTSSPSVDMRDVNESYGTKTGMSSFFLRLKMPDFPAHLYIDGRFIERDGDVQQRFMGGSGWFNSIVRASQKRSIDQQVKEITVGANSHLGPLEVEISHDEKRFDAGGDKVLFEAYGPAGFPPFLFVRQAGVFPHNLTPELKGSSDTLKIHTSYTGALVASATFSRIERENRDSRAKADYFIGTGEVTWMPMPKLTFFLKYRHRETDIDNPLSVSITDRFDPSNTITYSVKPSISSISDILSGTARYRLLKGLTLRAEYSFESIRRENAAEWHIPDSTKRNAVAVSADARILRNLTVKARYTHKDVDNPAYNNEPDRADEGRLSVSWVPFSMINTLLSYSVARESRSSLFFLDSNENRVEGAKNRDVNRHRFLGSVTFLILKDLSLTTSYSYMYDRVRQDIAFQKDISPDFPVSVDPLAPFRNVASNYAVDLNYIPSDRISLGAAVNRTLSRGTFQSDSQDLASIAAFSNIRIRETIYSINGEYKFRNGFSRCVRYRYSDFNDVLENPHDEIKDGKAHIILFSLSKRWR